MYGFGIRLGIYLQWLSSLIATTFSEHQRTRLTAAYISFQIAMLEAFLAVMIGDTCVFTVEAIIVVYFLLGESRA